MSQKLMARVLKAVRYRSLDEARNVLKEVAQRHPLNIFDDGGEEPQGLLAVVPEDRVPEEVFYRLFDSRKGVLVEVEKISYSGYGPPADESHYMGFVTENTAYVLAGRRLPIEIENCSQGAQDIHHLEALILDHQHPLNRDDLRKRLKLNADWDFEDLFELIAQGSYTAQEIDRLIHHGIQ